MQARFLQQSLYVELDRTHGYALLFGIVGACAAGGLSVLAGAPWAQAVLTGAGAFLALVAFLDTIIG